MKNIVTILISFFCLSIYSQSVDSIIEKISTKICQCINDDIKNSSEIRSEFNRCYDQEFNFIFNIINSDEQKILIQQGNLSKVKNGIIPYLDNNCEKIKETVSSEINNAIEKALNDKTASFPVNFTSKKWNKIKRWENKIIALEGEVIEITRTKQNTPYYKLRIGENAIWVASMIDSENEKVGNLIRVVGYLFEILENDNQYETSIHNEKHHIIAFGVINMENNKLAYFPGAVNQIKEWIGGKIPSAQE